MEKRFTSCINKRDGRELHRFNSHVGFTNKVGGIPPNYFVSLFFFMFLILLINSWYLTIIPLGNFLLLVIIVVFSLMLGRFSIKRNPLPNYEISQEKRYEGNTHYKLIDDKELSLDNEDISRTYQLSNCKSYFESTKGTYFVLSFPKRENVYIKKDKENAEDIEYLKKILANVPNIRKRKQSKFSNYMSPYLESGNAQEN